MKAIICYQTIDGAVHTSRDSAHRHADERYGQELTKLAHRLVSIEKYKEMVEFLDKYDFTSLMTLRKDLQETIPLPEDL